MVRVKITEGAWKDHEGDLVSTDGSTTVVRMAGNRLVEFNADRVEAVEAEPEADKE